MKRTPIAIVAALALCISGALASPALAEDGPPALLLLSGNVTELEGTMKGGGATLESVGKKSLAGSAVEFTVKGCKELESSKVDTSLCGPVTMKFTGVKKEAVACRSENGSGEKDPVETVLVSTDLHLAAGETAGKELDPLLLFKVLGAASGESELIVNCGTIKVKVKGVLGCLLTPGLTNVAGGSEFTLSCKQGSGKAETGTCDKLCEWTKEFPFEGSLNGKTFEAAAVAAEAKGALSKECDIFLDD